MLAWSQSHHSFFLFFLIIKVILTLQFGNEIQNVWEKTFWHVWEKKSVSVTSIPFSLYHSGVCLSPPDPTQVWKPYNNKCTKTRKIKDGILLQEISNGSLECTVVKNVLKSYLLWYLSVKWNYKILYITMFLYNSRTRIRECNHPFTKYKSHIHELELI